MRKRVQESIKEPRMQMDGSEKKAIVRSSRKNYALEINIFKF